MCKRDTRFHKALASVLQAASSSSFQHGRDHISHKNTRYIYSQPKRARYSAAQPAPSGPHKIAQPLLLSPLPANAQRLTRSASAPHSTIKMSQMGGGLRWHGVSKTGSTATSRIMNAAKAEREKANRSAPKVGSASVTDGDDWLAVAAAERAARERTGATGNAFADGASLVREAKRQATEDDDEFAIPAQSKKARVDDEADGPPPTEKPTEKVELSREAKREVELSIMELRDELEEEGLDEDAIDARCDALRTKLLEKAAADAVK